MASLRGAAAIVGVADDASPTGQLEIGGRELEAAMIEQALKLRFDDAGAKCFVGAEFDRRMLALSFLDHNRIDTTAMQLIARTVGKEIERQVYELIMHRGHRDHRDTENTR